MIIYEILTERDNETMLLYKEWDVQENFPVPANFTKISPPRKYHREKFDFMLNGWVEDEDGLVKDLKAKVADLETKLKASTTRSEMTEMALLELYDMILTR